VISVASNLLPRQVGDVPRLALSGQWESARRSHLQLLPLYEAMFIEASPAPVKFALSQRSRMTASVRLPLLAASEAARVKISEAVRRYEAGL
jgi:4-hydroxy-tetrahydrodipicolinate synthase